MTTSIDEVKQRLKAGKKNGKVIVTRCIIFNSGGIRGDKTHVKEYYEVNDSK